MKKLSLLFLTVLLSACSSMIPYKNQNLDYLHGIEQNPDAYRGKVVSFGGEVKGVTEDARRMRLIIKIEVPFYYYATGKDPLSYELLLISFDKKGMPQMTGIKKGSNVKVLARVANYETRKNLTGKPIAVLHLIAFALTDRDRNRDYFRPESPLKQLYESWKKGRLFFEEQPQEIEARYPAPQRKTITFIPRPAQPEEEKPAPAKGIVYDEEEPAFVLPPDPVSPTLTTPAETQEGNTPANEEQPLPVENSPVDKAPLSPGKERADDATEEFVQPPAHAQTDNKAPTEQDLYTVTQETAVSTTGETSQTTLPEETTISTEETTPETVSSQETAAKHKTPMPNSNDTVLETIQ